MNIILAAVRQGSQTEKYDPCRSQQTDPASPDQTSYGSSALPVQMPEGGAAGGWQPSRRHIPGMPAGRRIASSALLPALRAVELDKNNRIGARSPALLFGFCPGSLVVDEVHANISTDDSDTAGARYGQRASKGMPSTAQVSSASATKRGAKAASPPRGPEQAGETRRAS